MDLLNFALINAIISLLVLKVILQEFKIMRLEDELKELEDELEELEEQQDPPRPDICSGPNQNNEKK